MIDINLIVLLSIASIACILGTIQYRRFAIKNNILANLNFRTLHEKPIPSGGGIIFSSVFILSVFFLYFINDISFDLMLVFGIGSGFATIVGYIDDLRGINSLRKIFLQL